jgi:hypothetical protein
MSTPRGGRGGNRARGIRGGGAPSRGTPVRGRGNSNLAQNNNDRPTQGLYTRGQPSQFGQRGGRGSANTRDIQNARGSTRGRGGNA